MKEKKKTTARISPLIAVNNGVEIPALGLGVVAALRSQATDVEYHLYPR